MFLDFFKKFWFFLIFLLIPFVASIPDFVTTLSWFKHPNAFYFYWIFILIAIILILFWFYRLYPFRLLLHGDKREIKKALSYFLKRIENDRVNHFDMAGLLYFWFFTDDDERFENFAICLLEKCLEKNFKIRKWNSILDKLLLSNDPEIAQRSEKLLDQISNNNLIDLFSVFESEEKRRLQSKYYQRIKILIEDENTKLSNSQIKDIIVRMSRAVIENPHDEITKSLFNTLHTLWSKLNDKKVLYENKEFLTNLKELLAKYEFPISIHFLEFRKDFFEIIIDIDGPDSLKWTDEKLNFFKNKLIDKSENSLDYIFFDPIVKSLNYANLKILDNIKRTDVK